MHLRAVTPGAAGPAGVREAGQAPRPASQAVLRAVTTIRERYAEHLTLDGLASEVYVSPFHFCRLFARETGLTPRRFLTAVRLFEAKRLLLTTTLAVAEIVTAVGYTSVGTFTSRFTKAVGLTPSQYRDPAVRALLVAVAPRLSRMPALADLNQASRTCGTGGGSGSITARVSLPAGVPDADVLIGLFADRVPQRGPVVYTGLPGVCTGDRVTLSDVPAGRWYLMAVAEDAPDLSVGLRDAPVFISPHDHAIVGVGLHNPEPTDAPVAFTLACTSGPARHTAARPAGLAG
jgi:AraC-like DNA-binding protein